MRLAIPNARGRPPARGPNVLSSRSGRFLQNLRCYTAAVIKRQTTRPKSVDARRQQELRRLLLAWYRLHRRRLPWRAQEPAVSNPYHVLVSEAMLQQTQVDTVVGYFQRFVRAFPTFAALAAADEQAVLLLWQGLGYYRRARHLHAAARKIVHEHGGEVPDDPALIAKLPGVGRYTAGAIASIAFGKPEPILDGNVARVLARWFAIERPIDQAAVRAELWELAAALAPGESPGDFNQAMMELGALVCSPRSPRCLGCPVASLCQAHARGVTETIPARLPRKAPRKVEHHVLAMRRGGKYLFEQRPARGLWANLWQLPTIETWSGSVSPRRVRKWIAEQIGLEAEPPEPLERFAYQTTHRSLSVQLWAAEVGAGRPREGMLWRALDNVDDLPISNLQKRAMGGLRKK